MPGPGGGAARWQVALLLGAPLALGLGYLYYLRARRSAGTARAQSDGGGRSQAVSLDEEAQAAQSDLERALKLKVAGNKAFHAADYEEAVRLYESAIAACPPDRPEELATFFQNRSACHEKRERWDLVKDDCTEALRLNGRYVRAFLRRARAAEKSGDLQMALEDVTAACILEQFKVRATLVTADRVLKALGRRHAAEAAAGREPAMPSARVVRGYLDSFARDPAFVATVEPGTAFAKARAAVDGERYAEAAVACGEEIDAGGTRSAEARLLRGTLSLLLGDREAALRDLDPLADGTAPNGVRTDVRVNALVKRATLNLQAEDAAACSADFEHALSLDPDDADLRHHRGQAHMLAGELAEAQREFAKAVELNPQSALAHLQMCYAEFNMAKASLRGEPPLVALRAFEKVVEKFPRCPEALVLYAEVLSDVEEYTRAGEMFDRAIAIDPKNANVYVHRAILQLKAAGDVEAAVALIDQAIETDEKCLFAYETLGTIEVQRDNLQKAISLFEKAIKLTRTEVEMTHIFSLRDAAVAQLKVAERWGLQAPTINLEE